MKSVRPRGSGWVLDEEAKAEVTVQPSKPTQDRMASEDHQGEFDVIVIGAGINGAGIARDAAMRGLKVLVLDKGDIGGGTSSWSTRLIHGGLRYLEHGEFGLVRESLRERACLMQIAPHLVRPIPLLVPIYKHARRGRWTIRAGLIAYDALSFDKPLPRHKMLSANQTSAHAPGLNSEGLLGAALFSDAQVTFAERLVLENTLSAIEHGATVITYGYVNRLPVEDGQVRGVEFTQMQNPWSNRQGQFASGNAGVSPACWSNSASMDSLDRQSVAARVVVNAAGPWVDQVLEQGAGDSPRLIGGTKGSHIIVAPFAGAPKSAIYVEAETDARPFFIIPWNGNYLIGTTDIRYSGDLDHVQIDSEEINYLLRETNRVIPKAQLTRESILYTYSGVRPLPFTGDEDEQSITRKHFIRRHPRVENLFSIVGGKLTTYRSLAEQTVDLIIRKLQRESKKCTTDREPLPGAATPDFEAFCSDFKRRCGLSETISDRLLRIYGTRSSAILNLIGENPSLAEEFDSETGVVAAEVIFSFKHELAQTLGDCLLRRTMVGLNSSCGLDAADAAGRIAQTHLGWSNSRVQEELAAYKKYIARFLGPVPLGPRASRPQ
ncbi:MAG TPA: glycerol-3-phosphate dehydrogenase/oxidase [Pyrinomonadaceae bacterium]